jgi:hypothetical protein
MSTLQQELARPTSFRDCLPLFRALAHVPQGLGDRQTNPLFDRGIPIADDQGDKDVGLFQPSVLMLSPEVYYTTEISIHSVGAFDLFQIGSLSSLSREPRSQDPEQIEFKLAMCLPPG